jgi:Fe-S-cluster-containing dehydrogenase component
MTKCTLCVDRIYDELLPPQDRKPACVKACPTGARLFGDVKDPNSEVSQAIRERGGYQLMPEWDTQPANHYLPRQVTKSKAAQAQPEFRLGNYLNIKPLADPPKQGSDALEKDAR